LYNQFITFMDLFKKSNYDQSYLQDHKRILANVYLKFWDADKEEVFVVEDENPYEEEM